MMRSLTYGLRAWRSKTLAVTLVLCATVALPARAETVHLLALGDSLTQGYGLIEDEGFVPQMRAWLAERGHDVRLVNGGV